MQQFNDPVIMDAEATYYEPKIAEQLTIRSRGSILVDFFLIKIFFRIFWLETLKLLKKLIYIWLSLLMLFYYFIVLI